KQLAITPDQVKENTEITIKSLIRACAFLQYRVGKLDINDLNYKLMLLPLAYILRSDDIWNSKASIGKLEYWYWSSLFGGSYREKQNQRCIEDIAALHEWLKFDNENTKETVERENPFINRHSKILKY